jgi:Bacteriocin-protection, YdeI or OmpD-Associated/Domain of unknown function (DUF1905)
MHSFAGPILKFDSKGEKTGWTYLPIPADIIKKLKLKDKKGFRIKGMMDNVAFEKLSTYPIGGGEFIIAINGDMRKKLGKKEGAMLRIKFEMDENINWECKELMACLKEDPEAMKRFKALLPSHQNYHHRYIDTAKTAATKAARIVNTINALYKGQNFGEMIRSLKKT